MKYIFEFFSDPIRKNAFLILVVISLLLSFSDITKNGIVLTLVASLFNLLYIPFSIFLIFHIRGTKKNKNNIESEIGVWGYCWRSLIIITFGILISVVAFKVAFSIQLPSENIFIYVALYTANICILPFVTWLLFSKDRKGQIQWALNTIRGY